MYSFFTDEEKKEVFGYLISFIENAEPDLADEGIYGVSNILQYLNHIQRSEFFYLLIKICNKKSDEHLKYVALENIINLIDLFSEEFKTNQRSIIYDKIKNLNNKIKKSKNPKVILSYIRVYLKFNYLFDQNDEKILFHLVEKLIKLIENGNIRDFLEILISITNILKFFSINEFISTVLEFILKLYKNRDSLEHIIKDLLDEFIEIIWNFISDEIKQKFY